MEIRLRHLPIQIQKEMLKQMGAELTSDRGIHPHIIINILVVVIWTMLLISMDSLLPKLWRNLRMQSYGET